MLDKLGNERSEIVIDATFLKVANKLLLNTNVQSLELFVLVLE